MRHSKRLRAWICQKKRLKTTKNASQNVTGPLKQSVKTPATLTLKCMKVIVYQIWALISQKMVKMPATRNVPMFMLNLVVALTKSFASRAILTRKAPWIKVLTMMTSVKWMWQVKVHTCRSMHQLWGMKIHRWAQSLARRPSRRKSVMGLLRLSGPSCKRTSN